MVMPRILPVVLGSTAIVCTAAILSIHIILTGHIHNLASVRTSAVISASLEGLVVVVLAFVFVTYFVLKAPQHTKRSQSIFFGCSVLTSTLATISSCVTLVTLGKASKFGTDELLGANQTSFLIGASAALGTAFASQLIFLVVHFVLIRIPPNGMIESLSTDEEDLRQHRLEVKSIPYSKTSPKRSFSLDSNGYHERPNTTEDGFDSWDTSAVDPQNRQTVLQSSSPTPGFLALRTRNRLRRPARPTFTPLPIRLSHASPLATPGTIVMAAPNAGQIISDRQSIRSLSRMRSGSLPTAPSP
ncbi:unnamed protein product [Parascedosporium putredinis]|uniref:Uncharacterized protein n=1 Tax=Parascedosporium putredinis TaxID=1442378 RepID=A0A9P1MBS4_9PEZI|nr:unnamed protein product [Parascedosporium putredinis]CAI8000132.1 unnamed protein product [Parascedosporium putredinis]